MKKLFIISLLLFTACNPFFFLPPYKEGKHYTQPTTQTDITRGQEVAACLQRWAHSNGYPLVDYTDVDFTKLVIVGVGDPGVVGIYNKATFLVAGRENGDTVFYGLRLSRSSGEFIAIERHEDVHIVQESHPELEGPNHDMHYPPPFNYCQIPLAIYTQ